MKSGRRKNHALQEKGTKQEKQDSLVRRNVKDRLFRYIFEQDRGALLELYNALNGTDASSFILGRNTSGSSGNMGRKKSTGQSF